MTINKDLSIIIFGRLIQIIIMLISIRILTTIFTAQELGSYYIILSILALYNLSFLSPIEAYINRNLIEWNQSKNLVNIIFVFAIYVMFIAVFIVLISYYAYIFMDYKDNFELTIFLLFIFFTIIISSLHRKIIYSLNILGKRKLFMISLVSTLLFGLCLSILITKYFDSSVFSWLFGIVISEFVFLIYIYQQYKENHLLDIKAIKKKLTKKRIRIIIEFSVPLIFATLFMWGQNTGYRLLIEYKYSTELLGNIAVGLSLPIAIFGATQSIISQYFQPIFLANIFKANKENRTLAWNNMATPVLTIYIILLIFIVIFSKVLVNILLNDQYSHVYIYVVIGAFIEFFRALTNLLISVAHSEYKTNAIVFPYIYGFIISISMIYFIDLEVKYFIIPLILTFSYFIIFISMYFNMKKLLNISFKINIFKIIYTSLPLVTFLLIKTENLSLFVNFVYLIIYGFYLLFILYINIKENK